jgi:hypothetical protein
VIVAQQHLVRALTLLAFLGLWFCDAAPAAAQQPQNAGAPETFSARAQAENSAGAAVSAPILIHVERFTPDFDRAAVQEALRVGGYPGFLTALRKAPNVGYVELGGRKTMIRWARQAPSDTGRTIVVVTERPVAFIGGQADAKPRAGYEVAVIQLKVDGQGNGAGTMAAAARVRPGGETGVQIDDYAAEAPITLMKVTRK